MKRSEVNTIIREADAFIRQQGFHLPPFARWTPDDWARKGASAGQIIERRLGWDVTDFGRGNYRKYGLFLFTLRNGSIEDLSRGTGMVYAEKLLIMELDQGNPLHFHWLKTEDIINRGGGQLVIQLYNAAEDETLADTQVTVFTDGLERTVEAGGRVVLSPGESITLRPRVYHRFWAAESRVLAGEVSTVNDDQTDNRFYEPLPRFSEIEEDESPLYYLVSDYERFLGGGIDHPPAPDRRHRPPAV